MSHPTPRPEGTAVPAARPAEYAQLRRAFERQLTWAHDFARVGDLESARDAQRAADAVRDELSAD